MCRKLGVPRSLVYYKKKARKIDSELENAVIEIFRKPVIITVPGR